jgi:gamma-glutamyltranspeptidase/glutathione hydrolase
VTPHSTHSAALAAVRAAVVGLAVLMTAHVLPAWAQRSDDPEFGTGFEIKKLARARTHMVAAAHPKAVEAGLEMLRAGGSALDAAIAAQLVLNLVEPQSSGIGGGAFLLNWDQRSRRLASYDGRETAPAGAGSDLFLSSGGEPMRFPDAVFGGASVGAPGVLRMLALAHARSGRLPWQNLFGPAIRLADEGFMVSPRLSKLLARRGPDRFDATARAYFFNAAGKPHQAGERLKNPAFAASLRGIAAKGAGAFYEGDIADQIVSAVTGAPHRTGSLSRKDLSAYTAKVRPAVCTVYRRYRICGMGPPSSGGLAVAMTLKLVEPLDLGRNPMNAAALHTVVEAEKLVYADRNRWIADPDSVSVPAGLLDPKYLISRRKWISLEHARPKAEPGLPPGAKLDKAGVDATVEQAGTSHVSVIDRYDNAVALTTSIETAFGSGLMAGGFLLNNQLTDFSFRPVDADGVPIANAVGPGKRPRSSMAPTIVFHPSGKVFAVLGSPGGSRIPLYVVKTLIGLIDWRLDAQAAVDLPNFGSRNGPLELEKDVAGLLTTLAMQKRGHVIRLGGMNSGVHLIVRRGPGRLEGGADPRREGLAGGE